MIATDLPAVANPFRSARVVGAGIPPEDYQRQSVERGHPEYIMSRGELVEFLVCPSRWLKGFTRKDSDATDWGTLIDIMLLSPDEVDKRLAITPAVYPCTPTKKDPRTEKPWTFQATYCKEWREEAESTGRIVVTHADFKEAKAALAVLAEDAEIQEFISCSATQVMAIGQYEDEATGLTVPVKILLDLVPDKHHPRFGRSLGDFKTGFTAHPRAWEKAVFERDYHTQGALYTDVYTAATGEDRCEWRHVIQESIVPWQTAKRFLSEQYMTIGRMKYLDALKRYCQCLRSGHFPDYDEPHGAEIVCDGWKMVNPQPWMVAV